MRVEIRTQKGVPHLMPSGEGRTNTEYQVLLTDRAGGVVVASFLTPGSFLDGFLSDTQAKVRAKETADRLKQFLSSQGQLEEDEAVPVVKATRKPTPKSFDRREDEMRSFQPRTA